MAEIGRSLRRFEDARLLRGGGRFLADLGLPGMLEAVFVRSSHAHARIVRLDAAKARSVSGVAAVITAADLAGRTEPLDIASQLHVPEELRRAANIVSRSHAVPLLAGAGVRYVGQPIAMIVASDRAAALEAVESIEVDYESVPAVLDLDDALAADAPLVEPDWDTNVAFSASVRKGDPESAFATAPVVVEEELRIARCAAVPLEPRGVVAALDPMQRELLVWAGTQAPHILKGLLAAALRLAPDHIRVVAPDTGGGFGQKSVQCVEEVLTAFAALETRRPVRWQEERGENLVAAPHARAQRHKIAVAATEDGRILAVRDEATIDFGAFNVLSLVIPYNTLTHLLGPYIVPHAALSVRAVLTNTSLTGPYRGAGRPEAAFAMERMIDRLAAHLGLDAVDVRRRNLIAADSMPYDTGLFYSDGRKQVYDSGNFPELLRRASAAVAPETVRARQRAWRAGEPLIGVGFALYVEGTGRGPFEGARARLRDDGRIEIASGATSQGQGHATVFAQIAADALGISVADIEVVGTDTATLPFGIGTIGSRSAVTAGNAIDRAAGLLKARILSVAESLLEAAAADLELAQGAVRVRGVQQRAVSLAEVARAAASDVLRRGAPGDGVLAETSYFAPPTATYASAAHAAIVAIDPETGAVAVERYLVVHDSGRLINPLIAEGQIVGGVAQGLGTALFEEFVYDARGEPLTGSLADYALPTAAVVPAIECEHLETLSTRNPLGVKGLGEGGAIGAPAAIANAVEDALRPLGIVVRAVPLTPQRIRDLIAASAR
ncbi:MAG TPA: xanthine dehydrogenase family protein molybdopterin-binding subunit [Stellaceae bacterium]|nr:xanthine dehydrogenase family protein molybdopterin-binding subunit [Stellaceae bacterium]